MKIVPAFLLFLFLCSGLAKAEDITLSSSGSSSEQNTINDALETVYNAGGGTVYLNAGVYEIDGPIRIGSNTVLTGSKDAIIRVSSSSSKWFIGSVGIISARDFPLQNVEIHNFQIDGNLDQLPRSYADSRADTDHDCERGILLGGSSGSFMNNISVHHMEIYDLYSDGIHIRFANNVNCYNNFVSNCQHSGIYYVSVVSGVIKFNRVAGITSDCVRLDNCVDNIVSDNFLFSYTGDNANGAYKGGQNSLQIADQGYSHGGGSAKPTSTKNIEVFNNTFTNTGLRAIWLDSTGKGVTNVFIHDNSFLDIGEIITNGEPVSISNLPTKELSKKIFDNIFDILNIEYLDNGLVVSENVYPEINWQEKGKSRAWIDIVGWNNLTERNGTFYIPEGEEPIIKYEAENTASRPVSTKTNVSYATSENGTLTADLKVKAVYEVAKKKTTSFNGIPVQSFELVRKTKTSHYTDSEPIPETYIPSVNSTAYVLILNTSKAPQTRVLVPESPDVMKVLFEYNDTQTWHYLRTGTYNLTEKGVKYVQISELEYWEGENISRIGNTLIYTGALDAKKIESQIKITQFDVYGNEIPITDYQIEVRNIDEKKIVPPITLLFSGLVGIFLIGIYKVIGVFL